MESINIFLMGDFELFDGNDNITRKLNRSKKGVNLVQYLIVNFGVPVQNRRLIEALWPEEENGNPENALKTLVSRTRAQMNEIKEGFGNCIAADRGAYHWENNADVTVDVFQLEQLLTTLEKGGQFNKDVQAQYEDMLRLYRGDLLHGEEFDWAVSKGVQLHDRFMEAIYRYIESLKEFSDFTEIIRVCRAALEADPFDTQLNLELMSALSKNNRNHEAMQQYKHITNLHFKYLGVTPPPAIQEFYKKILHASKALDLNLDEIRHELAEYDEVRGAFICEYAVFKEIFNLQMRNLERLGSTMFLALIMIGSMNGQPLEPMELSNVMDGLIEILRTNLRKGDTITHFNANLVAMLLPTVQYDTGKMVMERIKRVFYRKYPNSNVMFNYRIGPLSSDQ